MAVCLHKITCDIGLFNTKGKFIWTEQMRTFPFYTQASWKAVQLSPRGQDGRSVPAFQGWNTHTFRTNSQPQTLPEKGLFPSVHCMEGGWRERKDGATENSAPCQHPSPKGTPNQVPCLEPVSWPILEAQIICFAQSFPSQTHLLSFLWT